MRRCPPPIANSALHTDRSVPGIHFICKQKILMLMHQDFLVYKRLKSGCKSQ